MGSEVEALVTEYKKSYPKHICFERKFNVGGGLDTTLLKSFSNFNFYLMKFFLPLKYF